MSFSDFSRQLRTRPGLLPLVGAVATWTVVWAVFGLQDVLAQTDIGRGVAGDRIDPHEFGQLVFVAAYSAIRWAAGMAVLAAGTVAIWWGTRRQEARS